MKLGKLLAIPALILGLTLPVFCRPAIDSGLPDGGGRNMGIRDGYREGPGKPTHHKAVHHKGHKAPKHKNPHGKVHH
jgi:hypothetical protein